MFRRHFSEKGWPVEDPHAFEKLTAEHLRKAYSQGRRPQADQHRPCQIIQGLEDEIPKIQTVFGV